MNLIHDIVIADSGDFDNILADSGNTLPLDAMQQVGVSIDDVVSIMGILRGVIDDRSAWWKLRREAYGNFASHEKIASRTLARLPDDMRDQLVGLDDSQIRSLCEVWINQKQTTPRSVEAAAESLTQLIAACVKAQASSCCVFIRSHESGNAFEIAFSGLEGKQLEKYRKAFDSWDAVRKHEAHERYKYLETQGYSRRLEFVLKEFSRQKSTKINLKADQRKVLRHIKRRIKDYGKNENTGPGKPEDSITLITMASSFDQAGWIALVFDTRPDAEPDGEWNNYIEENAVEFDQWCDAWVRLCGDGTPIKVKCHDGAEQTFHSDADTEKLAACIGKMLRDCLVGLRDDGAFAKLPLADRCLMYVDEHDGKYGWPEIEKIHTDGRVN